jgi:hypothetical protein
MLGIVMLAVGLAWMQTRLPFYLLGGVTQSTAASQHCGPIARSYSQPRCVNYCWIAGNVRATTIYAAMGAALTVLGLTAPVYACRNPHTKVAAILLEAIPTAAEKSEVIAKVEILEVSYSDIPGYHSFPVARALVIQSIRGTEDGQIIEINAEGDCGNSLDPRSVGRSGFIAGHFFRLANKTFFIGSW